MFFVLYNYSSKIYFISGKCNQLINVSFTLLLVWNRHQNGSGPGLTGGRDGKKENSYAKYLGEKPSSPQAALPGLKPCSSCIPFYKCRYNVFLHLLEIPEKKNPKTQPPTNQRPPNKKTQNQTQERRKEDIPESSLAWGLSWLLGTSRNFLHLKLAFCQHNVGYLEQTK